MRRKSDIIIFRKRQFVCAILSKNKTRAADMKACTQAVSVCLDLFALHYAALFFIQDKKPPAMQVECINFSKSIWRKNRQKSLLDIQ